MTHATKPTELELDAIYRQHARFVWRVAAALGVAPQERDDVVHDVFLVVHRRFAAYDPTRSLTTWMFGVTRMVVLNRRRQAERNARKLRVVAQPEEPADPEALDDDRRRVALVRAFLDSLEPRKRVVFELIEIEGLTGPEAAEAVGANVDTVYTRLRAARLAFREFVAAHAQQGGDRG